MSRTFFLSETRLMSAHVRYLTVWLLLVVVSLISLPHRAGACPGLDCFSAAQQGTTRRFLHLMRYNLQGDVIKSWGIFDFCEWDGVGCPNSNGVSLVLDKRNVSGTFFELPSSVDGSLIVITTISVSDNVELAGTLPASWGALTRLRLFSAHDTSLTGTIPSSWSSLSSLVAFDVTNTHVSGSLPPQWGSMQSLMQFFAQKTNVSGPLPSLWGAMRGLQQVSLAHTQVSGTLPPEWSNAAILWQIDLSFTQVEGTIPQSWGSLEKLTTVSLGNTSVTCCLPYEWLCNRSFTTGSVGMTSAASELCLPASTVCAATWSMHSTACVSTTTTSEPPTSTKKSARAIPVWAIVVIAVVGAVLVFVPLTLLLCRCVRGNCGFLPCLSSSPSSFQNTDNVGRSEGGVTSTADARSFGVDAVDNCITEYFSDFPLPAEGNPLDPDLWRKDS